MMTFFSPRSRMTVARPVAIVMNTLNLLGPALLLLALVLLGIARFGDLPRDARAALTTYGAGLIGASIVIRIAWGAAVRALLRRKHAQPHTHSRAG